MGFTTAIAAVADGNGEYEISEVEIDDPAPGELQVSLRASGLCHTDVNLLGSGLRAVMGHEGAGVVTKVGQGVTSVHTGDPVMLNWARSCGVCHACRAGFTSLCTAQVPVHEGAYRHRGKSVSASFDLGTMSTIALVHEKAAVPITVEIPWTSACLFGCCVMTGFGSAVNVAKIQPGASVVVIGAGAVGICAIQGAKIAGAKIIVAIDTNPAKLDAAHAFGATHSIRVERDDPNLTEAAAKADVLTSGGADVAFESTSVPALCTAPLLFVRNGGTAVQISGTEERVLIDAAAFLWDKIYIAPLYGRCNPRRDFPRLQHLYAEGQLKVDELVTRVYPLARLDLAIDDLLAGRNVKSVLVME